MGSRGPKPERVAATPGGGAYGPAISREDAADALGIFEIDEATWEEIVRAHIDLRIRLTDAGSSFRLTARDSRGARSYEAMRERFSARLDRAMSELQGLGHDDMTTLDQSCSDHRRLTGCGPSDEILPDTLDQALKLVQRARLMVRDAETMQDNPASEAAVKAAFVRKLRDICDQAGLPSSVNTGWGLDSAEHPSLADLAPFELLLWHLRIHVPKDDERAVANFAAWLRAALKDRA